MTDNPMLPKKDKDADYYIKKKNEKCSRLRNSNPKKKLK